MTFRLIQNDEDPSIYDVTLELPRGHVQLHFEAGVGSVHVFDPDGNDVSQTARVQAYGMDHAHGHINTAADVLCLLLWLTSHDWNKALEEVARTDCAVTGDNFDQLDEDQQAAYRQHAKDMIAQFLRHIQGG
jgi:hypothetical protein